MKNGLTWPCLLGMVWERKEREMDGRVPVDPPQTHAHSCGKSHILLWGTDPRGRRVLGFECQDTFWYIGKLPEGFKLRRRDVEFATTEG